MVPEDHLLVTEQPFLKIPATDTDGFPRTLHSIFNNSIFSEDHQIQMDDDLASKGANQNKVKAPQPKLHFPGSSTIMGFIGRKDRSGNEKKKDFEGGVNERYEDENAPISTCAVSEVGDDSLPATKKHDSDHEEKPKIWKLGFNDATKSRGKGTPQQLPSNTEPPEEDESMKSFLKASRAFHGSRIVSETAKGAFFNPSASPNPPSKNTGLSTDSPLSHRILAVGVTGAILLIPFVVKFFDA